MVKAKKSGYKVSLSTKSDSNSPTEKKQTAKKVNTLTPTRPNKTSKRTSKEISKSGKVFSKKTKVTAQKSFKKPRVVQGSITPKHKKKSHVLKEIKYYQGLVGTISSRASFIKMVKEIMNSKEDNLFRFNSAALSIIQETTEYYITRVFEYATLAARHAKRVTVFPSDIRLVLRIKNGFDVA